MNENGLRLINPIFDFDFDGHTYQVRKASLEKVILFQTRFTQLTDAKDPAVEKKIAAYCIYLTLRDAIPEITEEKVAQTIPDVEMPDVVEYLGFMNRQKVELLRKILQRNAPDQTGEQSSTS